MIKYLEFDAFDEYGQHIIPINANNQPLIKTAAGGYSPELMKVIVSFKREPQYYYVVINALGSYEVWGSNRNGDAFPESGLRHVSLRTDMNTPEDYGYKTFEYYAKLYKHHVNKDPLNSFGDIIFSHWNDKLKRVELIVGIDRFKGKDIVDALDSGDNVAVSMGCKVKHDKCLICNNLSATREGYCKHLKNYLRELVDDNLAKQWSKEVGRIILPGTVVCAINDFPRFFDISKVYIGADRTSFVLGKAASKSTTISGLAMGEAYGVTDDMIDKLSALGKKSEIEKEISGDALSKPDGEVVAIHKEDALKKAIDSMMQKTISHEPIIPNSVLDPIASTYPVDSIFSTMLGLGIHPKPVEVQRIVLISIKQPDAANYLNDNNMCFDHTEPVQEPSNININKNLFNDIIAKSLLPYIEKRSSFSPLLEKRAGLLFENVSDNDYWLEQGPKTVPAMETSPIPKELKILGSLAAIYAGLKLKAFGLSPAQIAETFIAKPWLRALLGGGAAVALMNKMIGNRSNVDQYIMRPASEYENILQDTKFSGHLQKYSSDETQLGLIAGSVILPSAYIANVYQQKSLVEKRKPLFQ